MKPLKDELNEIASFVEDYLKDRFPGCQVEFSITRVDINDYQREFKTSDTVCENSFDGKRHHFIHKKL